MAWADGYIEKLKEGAEVSFRPKGNSMRPKINSGDLVTVSPDASKIEAGDMVLCKVKGNQYVHLVKTTRNTKGKTTYQIGNNHGGINGWIGKDQIYGKVVQVEHK